MDRGEPAESMSYVLFHKIVSSYTSDKDLISECWNEICEKYSEPHRHYHTLDHIEFMVRKAIELKEHIRFFDEFILAVIYHDIIYDVPGNENEKKSASLAQKRLTDLDFPVEFISSCNELILATKDHRANKHPDSCLLVDIDLAIMGEPAEVYDSYVQNIKKEYAVYPDEVFYSERKKIIQGFLDRDRIYCSAIFYRSLELPARKNLERL